MSWLVSLLYQIPGISLFLKVVSFWSQLAAGVGKGVGLAVKSVAWAKSGLLGLTTTAVALGTGVTLYRDPDFFVSRYERLLTWCASKVDDLAKQTSSLFSQSGSWISEKTEHTLLSIKHYLYGYSMTHLLESETAKPLAWVPPVQDTNFFSPFASVRGAVQEILCWRPVSLRLHFLQEKGSRFITPYRSGQDVLEAEEGGKAALTSYQKFVNMVDSTIFHKMTDVQNSYGDRVIVLPKFLYDYYVSSVQRLNLMVKDYAELSATIDGSIPYIYYATIGLFVFIFSTKVLPVLAMYVRGLFDISIRKRQERLARKAWADERAVLLKERADRVPSTYELSTMERDFYRNYRESMGNLVKIGQQAERERPKVVTKSMNILADWVAILAQVRVFWPGFIYALYIGRTFTQITNLVALKAKIDREHEQVIRNMVMTYGEVLLSAQNELTLHRCQSILIAKADMLNWGYLYLSSANHTTIAVGVVWAFISVKTVSALYNGFSSIAGPVTNLLWNQSAKVGTGSLVAGTATALTQNAQTVQNPQLQVREIDLTKQETLADKDLLNPMPTGPALTPKSSVSDIAAVQENLVPNSEEKGGFFSHLLQSLKKPTDQPELRLQEQDDGSPITRLTEREMNTAIEDATVNSIKQDGLESTLQSVSQLSTGLTESETFLKKSAMFMARAMSSELDGAELRRKFSPTEVELAKRSGLTEIIDAFVEGVN